MNLIRRLKFPLHLFKPQLPKIMTVSLLTGALMYYKKPILMENVPKQEAPNNHLTQFTDQLYQELHEKNDLIILLDPERFQDEFSEELTQIVNQLEQHKAQSKRPLKVLVLKGPLTPKVVREFEEKYHIKIEYDSLMLFKNKYIQQFYVFNANEYFENRMIMYSYFQPVTKLNQKTYKKFEKILPALPKNEMVVLVYADKSSKQYKNILQRFNILKQHESYSGNQHLHWILIDKYASEQLNIAEPKDGSMYFLQRSSNLNYNKTNLVLENKKLLLSEAGSLTHKSLELVMIELTNSFYKHNVFANKSFGKQETQYSIILEVDLNKVSKDQVSSAIRAFGEVKQELIQKDDIEVELVYVNRPPKNNKTGIQVSIRNDELYAQKLKQHSSKDIDEIKQLKIYDHFGEPHSYTYRLNENLKINKNTILALLEGVQNEMAEEYFASQEEPKYRKYSKKLVAQSFRENVIDYPEDVAIFQYSKNCHACGQYGKYYEELALEHLKRQSKVLYCRMNNDLNKPDCLQDYPYTPVFMVCKKGIKNKPYIYRNQKFTPDLLKNFYEITTELEIIPEEQFQRIQQQHSKVQL